MKNEQKCLCWLLATFGLAPLVALALLAVFPLTGCETAGQTETALVQAAGEAGGNYLLSAHRVNGVVDPAFLAGYEQMLPKVAAVMQGAVTPADFQAIVAAFKSSGQLSSGQEAALGFADSVTRSYVATNGGANMTPEGGATALAAGNLVQGMAASVGSITGTDWTLPVWVPPSQTPVVAAPAAAVLLAK